MWQDQHYVNTSIYFVILKIIAPALSNALLFILFYDHKINENLNTLWWFSASIAIFTLYRKSCHKPVLPTSAFQCDSTLGSPAALHPVSSSLLAQSQCGYVLITQLFSLVLREVTLPNPRVKLNPGYANPITVNSVDWIGGCFGESHVAQHWARHAKGRRSLKSGTVTYSSRWCHATFSHQPQP